MLQSAWSPRAGNTTEDPQALLLQEASREIEELKKRLEKIADHL